MAVIGEALVTLGTEGDLTGGLEGAVTSAAKNLLGPVGGIGAAAVGIGAGLAAIGGSFDSAFDNLRIKTGATGDDLDKLKGMFKTVVQDVPTDFGSASDAIATLSQRTGATGDVLQANTEQFLNLARITGTDLKTALSGGLGSLSAFGVGAKDQGGKLDELFRVTQRTGISFGDLSTTLQSAGPTLHAAGLSFEQSAALVGTLAKNGVDAGAVMPALGKALAVAAKDGKPASEVLQATIDAIKRAPNDTEAAGAALTVFGAKAGPRMAELIRQGKLGYEDLAKTLGSGDGIMKAAGDTDDFGEKLTLLKNKVLVDLEPVASRVFDAIGTAVGYVAPFVEEIANGFSNFFRVLGQGDGVTAAFGAAMSAFLPEGSELTDTMKKVQGAVGDVVDVFHAGYDFLSTHTDEVKGGLVALGVALLAFVVPPLVATAASAIAAVAPFVLVTAAVAALGFGAVYLYEHFAIVRTVIDDVRRFFVEKFVPALGVVVAFVQEQLIPRLVEFAGFIVDNVGPVLSALGELIKAIFGRVQDIIKIAVDVIKALWSVFGDDIIKIGKAVFGTIVDVLKGAFEIIKGVVKGALDIVKGIFEVFTGILNGDWSKLWQGLGDIVRGVYGAVKGAVTGLIDAVKGILGGFADIGDSIIDGMVKAIKAGAKKIGHAIIDTIPGGKTVVNAVSDALGLVGFADGGWVGGPAGAPQLAIVHGGEYVLSRDMLAGRATPSVSAASAAPSSAVNLPPGMIVVNVQGDIGPDRAAAIGQGIGDGFVDALDARRVAVMARAIA